LELEPELENAYITFLGATGTVTGSKYLVEANGIRVLVDCGLFQGLKRLRQRNWHPLPFDVSTLNAVILTHAHLDHSGYLPVLVKQGFNGPVYCTSGTHALCRILLPDSGHLQEEDARYANKKGFSRHHPALPLYTQSDAEESLTVFKPVDFQSPVELGPGISAMFTPVGHILGAAWLRLTINGKQIAFSGDVGRPNDPVMLAPQPIPYADCLIIESTYGDRLHDETDPAQLLSDIVNQAAKHGSVVLIPSFAVGRAQTILHILASLKESERIPSAIPVFLNSPMAINATRIFCAHHNEHRLDPIQCETMCNVAIYTNTVADSKALNQRRGPMVIISASGMATGGRILHHLKAFAGDPRNIILFAGYQASGTRGEAMVNGAKQVRIHGQQVPIRAKVVQIPGLSAHADYAEMTDWLRHIGRPPMRTFITHGEKNAAQAFARHLTAEFNWPVEVPAEGAQITLQ